MSILISAFTLASFSAHLGSAFTLDGSDGLALTLTEAEPLTGQASGASSFSLIFRGPAHSLLEQATHTLAHPAMGLLSLFLVPVGREADGVRYQAIFD